MVDQPRIDAFIAALAEGNLLDESIKRAGLTREETAEVVRMPGFNDALNRKRGQVVENFRQDLQRGSVEAVAALRKLLKGGHYQTVINAAKALIDARHKVAQLDLEAKKLEQNQEVLPPAPEEEKKAPEEPGVLIDNALPPEHALQLWRMNRARKAK